MNKLVLVAIVVGLTYLSGIVIHDFMHYLEATDCVQLQIEAIKESHKTTLPQI